MAPKSRRQLILLAGLFVVLVAVLWWDLSDTGLTPSSTLPPRRAAGAGVARTNAPSEAVQPLRLSALTAPKPEPEGGERDPFRFESRRPSPGPTSGATGPVAPRPPTPPPASVVAPIPLKFIGIVQTASATKIAVLSDGRDVFYGREGETVEGRYRIERIGVESVEVAWADGRGRQVIRLSGS
jgi:hypothetical protein